MKFLSFLFLLFLNSAHAQDKAADIFKQASERAKKIRSLNYVTRHVTKYATINAEVTTKKSDKIQFPLFGQTMAKVSGVSLSGDGSTPIMLSYNGKSLYFLDNKTGQTTRLDDPNFSKMARTGQFEHADAIMTCYYNGLFDTIMNNAVKYKQMNDTAVYGVLCHTVNITTERYNDRVGKFITDYKFYIGKNDLMVYGYSTGFTTHFIQIKSIDKEYSDNYFTVGPSPAPLADAKAIIEQCNAHIKQLKSISLNCVDEATYRGPVSLDVTIQKDKDFVIFGNSRIKATGIISEPSGSKIISWTYDGVSFEFLNTANNQVNRIDSPTYRTIGRTGVLMSIPFILQRYSEKEAFDTSSQNNMRYSLVSDTVIYDVPCYKINAAGEREDEIAGKTQVSVNYYIGKETLLLYGESSRYGKSFIKIRSVNEDYSLAHFSLSKQGTTAAVTMPTEGFKNEALLALNTEAPDWTLPSNLNTPITLSKLRGKVVMLDFWGTWCAPCVKAMPHVQTIYDQFKTKGVEVIGVSVEIENAIDVPAFIKRKGFTYPIALNGKDIRKDYNVSQYPTIYIIDKKGKIVYRGYGGDLEQRKELIVQIIQKALAS